LGEIGDPDVKPAIEALLEIEGGHRGQEVGEGSTLEAPARRASSSSEPLTPQVIRAPPIGVRRP
jgi:hypothetical protein